MTTPRRQGADGAAAANSVPPSESALVERLRDEIIRGGLAPGHRLVEAELMAMFGGSRGTVRHALMVLESEGIVEREKNRGARVRQVSIQEAIEITEARSVLEGLCARKAAELATDEERAQLRAIGQTMEEAVSSGDVVGYAQVVQELHTRVRELSHQQTVAGLLERLRYQSVRHHFHVALLPGRPATGLAEHVEVIEAICDGDADRAEQVMRDHLTSVISALIELDKAPARTGPVHA